MNWLNRFFGTLRRETEEYEFAVASLNTPNEIATFDNANTMYRTIRGQFSNPDPVLKKLLKDISVYRSLLYHPHVSACVEKLTDRVTKQTWDIDRGRAKSRNAKLIKQILNDIDDSQPGGLSKVFEDIVMARLFGWQVFETPLRRLGKLLIPERIIGKPQEWFCYNYDRPGELLFKSKTRPEGEPVSPLQFTVIKHKDSYLNPYGIPQLAACYYPVIFERAAWSFRTVFIESNGQPKVIVKVRRGTSKEELRNIVESVANAVQDGVVGIPEDSNAEILKVNDKSSSEIYHDYKKDCEADISKAILGSTLAVEQGDKGSYSLGEVHSSEIDYKMHSLNRMIEQFFNRLIKNMMESSDISGERPLFVMFEEEKIDTARAERDLKLTQAGVRFTKTHFIEEYGFEEDEFDVPNPQSSIPNPQSSIPNPQSEILNPQSAIRNPQSSIPNPQSTIRNPQSEIQTFSADDDLNSLLNAYDALKKKSLTEPHSHSTTSSSTTFQTHS
jgi:phage gp29-like protein